jgi:hypothetical protein
MFTNLIKQSARAAQNLVKSVNHVPYVVRARYLSDAAIVEVQSVQSEKRDTPFNMLYPSSNALDSNVSEGRINESSVRVKAEKEIKGTLSSRFIKRGDSTPSLQ